MQKLNKPNTEMRFPMPQALHDKITLLLLDPYTEKTRYGSVGELGTRLFENWVKAVQGGLDPTLLPEKEDG